MGRAPSDPRPTEQAPAPETWQRHERIDASRLLRRLIDPIVRNWASAVAADESSGGATELVLREVVPLLLDELATWLTSAALPPMSPGLEEALSRVSTRLSAASPVPRVFREQRLLRAAVKDALAATVGSSDRPADAPGTGPGTEEDAAPTLLARVDAGLDAVLSRALEYLVLDRERRAAAARAEVSLASGETVAQYRSLLESMDQAFGLLEVLFEGEEPVDCRFLRVNPAFERHTGLKAATGKRIRELVPNHDQRWVEIYARVAQSGVPTWFEEEAPALDRIFEVYAVPVGAPHQRQVALLFSDVTARRRAEQAVRANDAQMTFRLRLSDALRPLVDAEEIHSTLTRLSLEFFGADRCFYCEIDQGRALVRRDASRSELPSMRGEHPLEDFPIFRGVLEAGRPLVVADTRTTELLDEPLRLLCLRLQIGAFLDVPIVKDGRAVGILCITQRLPRRWTDHEVALAVETAERSWAVLERARAEEALRAANARLTAANRHKNEFLAVLSHELRNPLAPLRNSLHILEQAVPGGEQALRARQVIDRQVQHLTRLIDDLLDVTRISGGKIVLQREPIDLAAIARLAAEDQRAAFADAGVELAMEDMTDAVWVEGDRTRLAQVIGNLLSNAAKFTPRGGRTQLSVAGRAGQATICVRDDGIGMSSDTQRHLFEPFRQAPQTIDRARGGLGLGLALIKGLVELHHGTITGRSEGLGRGSEFTVILPLRRPGDVVPAVDQKRDSLAPARRVLVVEDNIDSANSLSELLALGGSEVAVAYTGPAGLEAARRHHPDVIFCDIGLPELDGYEIARALRQDADPKLRQTFLVALSGYARPEDIETSRRAGFDHHLAKPPSLEALRQSLELASCESSGGAS